MKSFDKILALCVSLLLLVTCVVAQASQDPPNEDYTWFALPTIYSMPRLVSI